MNSTLSKDVLAWLERIIKTEFPPRDGIAYNVGLFETADGYSAYLVGAKKYDSESDDWACDEAYTPKEKYLTLPKEKYGLNNWEQVQNSVVTSVTNALSSHSLRDSFFSRATAITVGLDDGELVRVK